MPREAAPSRPSRDEDAITAVPDEDAAVRDEDAAMRPGEDAAMRPGEDRGPAGGPAGTGSRGVPPAEGEWVAGPRGPGHAAAAPGLDSTSPASGQPELPEPGEPGEPLDSPAVPGVPAVPRELGEPPVPGEPGVPGVPGEPGVPAEAAQADRPVQAAPVTGGRHAGGGAPLLTDQNGLRERWLQIQSGFIDDPRASVTEAAGFVAEITSTLVTAVQDRERSLRGAWDGSGDTDTEKLRNALLEYRTFFEFLTRL